MEKYKIISIQEKPELKNQAAEWFHSIWNIPKKAYLDSMDECLECKSEVPQWYVVLDEDKIIAGIGVIENDFHNRKDLTPNICAVYVEEDYRGKGIAGEMLQFVCDEFKIKGIDTLYLLTEHTSFYERYGWTYLCMVQGDGETSESGIYMHKV